MPTNMQTHIHTSMHTPLTYIRKLKTKISEVLGGGCRPVVGCLCSMHDQSSTPHHRKEKEKSLGCHCPGWPQAPEHFTYLELRECAMVPVLGPSSLCDIFILKLYIRVQILNPAHRCLTERQKRQPLLSVQAPLRKGLSHP